MNKDILARALKTFVQAAIAYIATINVSDLDLNDKTAVAGLFLSIVAAGCSAVWNIVLNAGGGKNENSR